VAVIAGWLLAPALARAEPPPADDAKKPLFTFTPYGFVHLAYYRDLGPFTTRDYPGQAIATSDGGSDLLSVRGSRIGLAAALRDPVGGARVGALVEADFKGGFVPSAYTTTTTTTCSSATPPVCTSSSTTTATAAATAWPTPLLRLRKAYLKATWSWHAGDLTLVAGQDQSVFARLSPYSLAYAADQLFVSAGNLNRRSPLVEVSFERRARVGWEATAEIASPTDAGTPVDLGAGNRSRRPDAEGRLGLFVPAGGTRLVDVGLSGHRNWRRYPSPAAPDVDVPEWGAAVDAAFRLSRLTLQGEAFTGSAIDDTYGGIAPAVNPTRNHAPVRSHGAWAQVILKPLRPVELVLGYGAERPSKADLAGLAARTRNAMLGGGVVVTPHDAWRIGVEAYRTVSYAQDANGVETRAESVQIAVATRLDF
jgi:hypothetical protein